MKQRPPGLLDTLRAALQTAARELDLPLETQHLRTMMAYLERELCREHGGTNLYVPALSGLQRQERNSTIRRDYAQGASFAELAHRYRLSETRIRQILTAR